MNKKLCTIILMLVSGFAFAGGTYIDPHDGKVYMEHKGGGHDLEKDKARGYRIDVKTGELQRSLKHGRIDPKTGQLQPNIGDGYVDQKTGKYHPY